MARRPKPWWNDDRGEYNVNIRGERHRLGPDKDEAERKFHELMAKPVEAPVVLVQLEMETSIGGLGSSGC